MRFSLIAFAGLAAFGDILGVQSRATPNDLAVSSRLPLRNEASVQDDMKRRLVSVLPRAPVLVAPKPLKPPVVDPPPVRPGVDAPGNPGDAPPPAAKPRPDGDSPDAPTKPVPLKPGAKPEVGAGAVCKLPKAKRSRLFGRAPYTRADAENPQKVLEWLNENEEYIASRGHSKNRIIFFSTGTNKLGEDMAWNFMDQNPSYAVYDKIFGSKFSGDFGKVAAKEGNVAKAASEALALWSKNPIVFNTGSAHAGSYWLLYEYPNMYDAGTITKMKDNALSLTETDGTIALPPRPNC